MKIYEKPLKITQNFIHNYHFFTPHFFQFMQPIIHSCNFLAKGKKELNYHLIALYPLYAIIETYIGYINYATLCLSSNIIAVNLTCKNENFKKDFFQQNEFFFDCLWNFSREHP